MGREDLPESILDVKSIPLSEHNPVALEALAAVPDKPLPVPKGKDKLRNLAQYAGRSRKGKRNSLSNLVRPVTQQIVATKAPPLLPAGTPVPSIVTAPIPKRVVDVLKEKYWKSVTSKEEWDLFILTWGKYLEAHPDYNQAEDEMDLETICYEEVIKWRINILRRKRPEKIGDVDLSYNQTCLRQQKARENLAARRSDRLGLNGAKQTTNNKINIAVLAANIDEKKLIELQQKAQRQMAGDLEFLDATTDLGSNLDVIDAEIVSEMKNSDPPAEELVLEGADNGIPNG